MKKTKEELKRFLTISVILGVLTYGFVFTQSTPSHDGLMIIKTHQLWEMAIGRFVAYYYSNLRGILETPWIIGVLAILYISFSAFLTMIILDIQFDAWKIFIVSSVFFSSIAFVSHAAVYLYCWDVHLLGLVFAVTGVYICTRFDKFPAYIAAALLMACSLGSYQSYISVAITLFLLILCKRLSDNEDTVDVIKHGVYYALTLILAAAFYILLIKLTQYVNGVVPYSEYRFLNAAKDKSLSLFFHNIVIAFKQVFRFFFKENGAML